MDVYWDYLGRAIPWALRFVWNTVVGKPFVSAGFAIFVLLIHVLKTRQGRRGWREVITAASPDATATTLKLAAGLLLLVLLIGAPANIVREEKSKTAVAKGEVEALEEAIALAREDGDRTRRELDRSENSVAMLESQLGSLREANHGLSSLLDKTVVEATHTTFSISLWQLWSDPQHPGSFPAEALIIPNRNFGPANFMLVADAPLKKASVGIVGPRAQLNYGVRILPDRKRALVSIGSPPGSPTSPIKLTLWAEEKIEDLRYIGLLK